MKKGFTLAEVLITLGILGVVIAMTMQTLVQKHQNKVIITQLNKTYSELQNIVNLISFEQNDDILNFVELTKEAELNKIFMSYYDNAKDCTANKCFENQNITYYTYAGNPIANSEGIQPINVYFSRPRFITKDGRLFIFGGRDSYGNNSATNYGQIISVDVNGYKQNPNRLGQDLFMFQISEQGKLLPMGAEGTTYYRETDEYCSKTSTSNMNGAGCTIKALTEKDYFSKL